jgi:hypothetical protein
LKVHKLDDLPLGGVEQLQRLPDAYIRNEAIVKVPGFVRLQGAGEVVGLNESSAEYIDRYVANDFEQPCSDGGLVRRGLWACERLQRSLLEHVAGALPVARQGDGVSKQAGPILDKLALDQIAHDEGAPILLMRTPSLMR